MIPGMNPRAMRQAMKKLGIQQQEIEEQSPEAEISKEDIQTVAEQTGKTEEESEQAIKDHNGDLAAAILELKSD